MHSFEIEEGEECGWRGLLGYYKIEGVILCAPIFKPIFNPFSIQFVLVSDPSEINTYLITLKLYKSPKIQTITWQCYIYSNFQL